MVPILAMERGMKMKHGNERGRVIVQAGSETLLNSRSLQRVKQILVSVMDTARTVGCW